MHMKICPSCTNAFRDELIREHIVFIKNHAYEQVMRITIQKDIRYKWIKIYVALDLILDKLSKEQTTPHENVQ